MPLVGFLNVPPIDPADLRPDTPPHRPAGLLVMLLFLASLTMGFGAAFVFYLIMWSRAEHWPPPGTPALPETLWVSTALVMLASLSMQAAVYGANNGRLRVYRHALLCTLLAGVAFLCSQTVTAVIYARALAGQRSMFSIGFYILAGLHAVHLLAGVVPLIVVTRHAWRQAYVMRLSPGALYCALYWHFVDATWLAIFLLVQLAR